MSVTVGTTLLEIIKKSAGPKQASTEVWENGLRKSMHGLLQNQSSTAPGPQVLGGAERNQFNPMLPNISGGYIDTGYPERTCC